MKIKILILFFITGVFLAENALSQVGIGTTTPEGSAKLDVTSTTRGFLLPRLTNDERNAISAPIAGLEIWCRDCGTTGEMQVYNGFAWTNMIGGTALQSPYATGSVYCGASTIVVEVTSGGGRIWMDRNLGASRVANDFYDASALGDLYQWGRRADGHQCRNPLSATIDTLALTNVPLHGKFIKTALTPFDWRSGQNVTLWQGANGTNNPCPSGFRLPTQSEWETEKSSWGATSTNWAITAWSSPLKLTVGGHRSGNAGLIGYPTTFGQYWTSTLNGTNSRYMNIYNAAAHIGTFERAYGLMVRCIKKLSSE